VAGDRARADGVGRLAPAGRDTGAAQTSIVRFARLPEQQALGWKPRWEPINDLHYTPLSRLLMVGIPRWRSIHAGAGDYMWPSLRRRQGPQHSPSCLIPQ